MTTPASQPSTREKAAPRPDVYLESDAVHYAADRIQTAAELLEEVLSKEWTDKEYVNIIFRDALVLLIQEESRELNEAARGAMNGKDSPCWTRTTPRRPLEGLQER